MRKRRVSHTAIANYVSLMNIATFKDLYLNELRVLRNIELAVINADDEVRAKVLLLILDEGTKVHEMMKMTEDREKEIRTKEEYIDPETMELVFPKA